MLRILAAAAVVASLAAPASATEITNSRSKSAKKQRCETTTEIGSRLARKRICMSEAEWREMRAQTRTDVEKILAQKQWEEND
ncbi:MAG TPA: hypothetical protein VGD19_03075 [Allosphingosinicella sp.]|jgi:hypothetical protein